MAVRKHYDNEDAFKLACRIDRAVGALSYVLNKFEPRPRGESKAVGLNNKPPRRVRPRAVAPTPPQRLVLDAMVEAFALAVESPGALGELTYYQIKSETGLTDERLGLALNSLIPHRLCTRSNGDERIYFLPRLIRRRLKARIEKGEMRKVA